MIFTVKIKVSLFCLCSNVKTEGPDLYFILLVELQIAGPRHNQDYIWLNDLNYKLIKTRGCHQNLDLSTIFKVDRSGDRD